MSTGSVRSCWGDGTPSVVTSVTFESLYVSCRGASDVEEPDVLGVALDERSPRLDVLTHQHAEQLGGLGRVVQGHLEQHPVGRVHGGFPQLGRVHLTETLEPLHTVARARILLARGDAGLD